MNETIKIRIIIIQIEGKYKVSLCWVYITGIYTTYIYIYNIYSASRVVVFFFHTGVFALRDAGLFRSPTFSTAVSSTTSLEEIDERVISFVRSFVHEGYVTCDPTHYTHYQYLYLRDPPPRLTGQEIFGRKTKARI